MSTFDLLIRRSILMEQQSNFDIYRASAGSGKTFSITREYLKLIFAEGGSFTSILAVTFTNKATAEMKGRIIGELKTLASREPSGHLETLMKFTNSSEYQIRQRAKKILSLILHNFSQFSVSTIDSFFQKVIRSFSREINLSSTYSSELDSKRVLTEAIELLFSNLDSNPHIKRWLSDYVKGKIREGKSWNFQNELISRGEIVIGEEFKLLTENPKLYAIIGDKEAIKKYKESLEEYQTIFIDNCREIGDEAFNVIEEYNLEITDFAYGKSGFFSLFKKLKEGDIAKATIGARVEKALESVEGCYSKTLVKKDPEKVDRITDVYNFKIYELLWSAADYLKESGTIYRTINEVLPQMYSLGILNDIASNIETIAKEKNMLLMSDSNRVLKSIIGDFTSPFIYEKIGNRYQNFMLDEFQDTSHMQWGNFLPLVENALSEGGKVTVVGDVKQSIYRWRGGDWQLLANKLPSDLRHFNPNGINLGTNWRSSKNVIDFNNAIFNTVPEMVQNDIKLELDDASEDIDSELCSSLSGMVDSAYLDNYQEFSNKKPNPGRVKVSFKESCEESNWKQKAIEETIATIESLQRKGYRAGDIAILVRSRGDGSEISKAVMLYGKSQGDPDICYDVVSSDSLFISSSPTVKFIISVLKVLSRPSDLDKATLLNEYYNYIVPLMDDVVDSSLPSETETISDENIFMVNRDYPPIFKNLFDDKNYTNRPIYELVESIISTFKLDKIESDQPYIFALLDIILDLSAKESYTISTLFDWWEEDGVKLTITTAESRDSINLCTVHKSKGLEFNIVLVPFCDWDIYPSSKGNMENSIWCRTDVEPISTLPIVPVKYKSGLKNTLFSSQYYEEHVLGAIDNINILYVAFTRAEKMLYVWSEKPNIKKRGSKAKVSSNKRVSDLLYNALSTPKMMDSEDRELFIDLASYWDENEECFTIGEVEKIVDKTRGEKRDKKVSPIPIREDKRINLRSRNSGTLSDNSVDYGIVIHDIFEHIETSEDVDLAIEMAVIDGKIDNIEAVEVKSTIESLISSPQASKWFSKDIKILNERQIILEGGTLIRPDRIVFTGNSVEIIDYKTGLYDPDKKIPYRYTQQVKEYVKHIKSMGYKDVNGYLWFTKTNSIVEI